MTGGAQNDLNLLVRCMNFTVSSGHRAEQEAIDILDRSGSSSAVNVLRMVRIQREIVAVGAFSMYESLLQSELGWSKPFDDLRNCLREQGHNDLSSRFEDYRTAINVLKHGIGPSHERLLKRRKELEFAIKEPSTFFCEGDIAEGQSLIDVEEKFIQRCAKLIGETWDELSAGMQCTS